jgi:hypothetical protein
MQIRIGLGNTCRGLLEEDPAAGIEEQTRPNLGIKWPYRLREQITTWPRRTDTLFASVAIHGRRLTVRSATAPIAV